MDKIERITALHRILKAARYPVTVKRLQEELGCSRATVYRDLAYLRDALMAPIEGDGEAGFRYHATESERFELPGLWLSSEELYALLAAQQLLVRTGGGVLSGALAPLQKRIEGLLADHAGVSQWPVDRVRVIPHRGRKLDEASFRTVASAVLERKQLQFEYRARSTDERTRRTVSPQRITRTHGTTSATPCAASPGTASAMHGWARSLRATCPTRSSTSTWPRVTASSPASPRAGRRSSSAPRPRAGSPTSSGIPSSRAATCPMAATS